MTTPFDQPNECADRYYVHRGDGRFTGDFETVPEAVEFCQSRDDKMELSISMFVGGDKIGAVRFGDICE